MSWVRAPRRAVGVAAATAAAGLVVAAMPLAPAMADTAPTGTLPATVSADVLPTWQVNGVVWSQVTVGTTVYVAGSFTKARPPGVAVGGAGEVAAANAFAYNITTGARVTTFHPQLNAQSNYVTASPDGTRVYYGGDFTTVDGQARSHIAAFDTATNTLSTTFKPAVSARVTAITVSPTQVYAGGWFKSAAGVARTYLAAFAPATGALQPWAPQPSDVITAMVLAPDRSRVIVSGRFLTMNGVNAYGMGSVDASTGKTVLPWAANTLIRDATDVGAIDTLRTDGTYIYGAGYVYGKTGANFEGTFSADPLTGNIRWLNDCHGDSYDVAPIGQVMYVASHEHDCTPIGAFPDNQVVEHRATAFTTYATGMNKGPDSWGINFSSKACGTILDWFPTLTPGTFTGQNQAAWSVTGNASYVAYGGEFPSVNGVAQQGLVRFATPALAPKKVGPVASSVVAPTGSSSTAGAISVSWRSAWDMDNQNLTYRVFRDAGTTAVYTVTAPSTFWNLPTLSFSDTGLVAGSSHTYRITVTDPNGNVVSGAASAAIKVSSTSTTTYATDAFGRTVSGGWGSADVGGAWTVTPASAWAVSGGVGTMTLASAGASATAYLGSVSKSSTDLQLSFSANKAGTGNGIYVYAVGRRVSGAGDYRAKVHLVAGGAVTVSLIRVSSAGTETAIVGETTVSGVTWAAGTQLRVRLQVKGASATTLRAHVWKVGTTEPSTWTVSATDSTAGLQVAGAVGVAGYLSGSTTNSPVVVSVDNLSAVSAG